jgi:hypothetical protein
MMNIIGARADDWRPDRADVHLGWWIGGFIAAVVFYLATAAIVGSIINGNGSPLLN